MKFLVIICICLVPCVITAQPLSGSIAAGNKLYEKGDFQGAVTEYEKALRSAEGDKAVAHYNLGNALHQMKLYDRAAQQFSEAANLSKDVNSLAKSSYNHALSLIRQNKLMPAIEYLKQVLKLDPADLEARQNLQRALQQLKQQQQQNQQQNQQKKQEKQPQNQQRDIDKRKAEELFRQLQQNEKQLQQQLQKQKPQPPQLEKDW